MFKKTYLLVHYPFYNDALVISSWHIKISVSASGARLVTNFPAKVKILPGATGEVEGGVRILGSGGPQVLWFLLKSTF